MQSKQLFFGIGALLSLAILLGAGFWVWKSKNLAPTPVAETPKKKAAPPVNELAVEDRPVVFIGPDGTRSLSLEIASMPLTSSEVEFELEYQAGNLLQGAFGQLSLQAIPAKTSVLLGSCSAGGACTYHENVQGGSILLRFESNQPYALKADWRYQSIDRTTASLSSRDGKFVIKQFTAKATGKAVVFNGLGFHPNPPGRVLSDPYAVKTTTPIDGEVEVIIRANETGVTSIAGWDGTGWQLLRTLEVNEKEIRGAGPLFQQYLAIKQ